jgi:hypothetical protein
MLAGARIDTPVMALDDPDDVLIWQPLGSGKTDQHLPGQLRNAAAIGADPKVAISVLENGINALPGQSLRNCVQSLAICVLDQSAGRTDPKYPVRAGKEPKNQLTRLEKQRESHPSAGALEVFGLDELEQAVLVGGEKPAVAAFRDVDDPFEVAIVGEAIPDHIAPGKFNNLFVAAKP